jgi:hypothetical protein
MEKQAKDPMKLPNNKEKMNKLKEELDIITTESSIKIRDILDEQTIVFAPITGTTIKSLLEYSNTIFSTINNMGTVSNSSGYTPTDSLREYSTVNLNPVVPQRPQTTQTTTRSTILRKTETVPPKFNCEWYYLDTAMKQLGPLSFTALKNKFRTAEINDSTYVFGAADQSDWKAIADFSELRRALSEVSSS